MTSRAWAIFRTVRVLIFALSTILSLAWTIIYTVLLLREWKEYNLSERAIVIIALAINGVAAILLYLMIVVKFHLWLDAARVAFILFFQLGATISFALLGPNFPCNNVGSQSDCRQVTAAAINGGWALAGLLLVYAFYLAVMSYVPLPPPPPNPESVLSDIKRSHSPTPSANSETWLLKSNGNKRKSINSVQSHGSSFIQPYNPSLRSNSPRTRSPSITNQQQIGMYRSNTPSSLHSSASSISLDGRGPREAVLPYSRPLASLPPARGLPNPFTDPVSRQPSLLSEVSFSSSGNSVYGPGYREQPYPLASPYQSTTSLNFGNNVSQGFPPPPYGIRSYPTRPHTPAFNPGSPNPGSPLSAGYLTVPGTPMALRPAVQNSPPREYTASPGVYSVHSMAASLHTPSRNGTPSRSGSYSGLPASPRLSPPPRMASAARGIQEIRRYGSSPDLHTMTFGAPPNSTHTRPGSATPPGSARAGTPDWVTHQPSRPIDTRQVRWDGV